MLFTPVLRPIRLSGPHGDPNPKVGEEEAGAGCWGGGGLEEVGVGVGSWLLGRRWRQMLRRSSSPRRLLVEQPASDVGEDWSPEDQTKPASNVGEDWSLEDQTKPA